VSGKIPKKLSQKSFKKIDKFVFSDINGVQEELCLVKEETPQNSISDLILGSFFLHPYIFLPAPP